MARKLDQFEVIQRTKDSMFDAGFLLYQWNKSNNNHRRRKMSEFLESPTTKEFISAMKDDYEPEGNIDLPDNQIVTTTKGKTSKSGQKSRDQVWMHPYLFIDFAMWINPRFKLQVIKFVYDQLIEHRHMAGDNYRKLCNSLSSFQGVDFSEVGRMLNYVIFNEHGKAKRNFATPEQEYDLQQLERDMINYIGMGFVNDYEQFKEVMRKEWSKRHGSSGKLSA